MCAGDDWRLLSIICVVYLKAWEKVSVESSLTMFIHLDPITGIVEPYAENVQHILKSKQIPSATPLWAMCFHATVYLNPSGAHYQTTPALVGVRGGGKSGGYREVLIVTARLLSNLYKKETSGGWRFCDSLAEGAQSITMQNLQSKIYVWQWCSKTRYSYFNDDWILYSENVIDGLEELWQKDDDDFELDVTTGIAVKTITVKRKDMFHKQRDKITGNARWVRRILMQQCEIDKIRNDCKEDCPDDMCPICMCDFAENASLPTIKLKCGHVFHQACLAPSNDKRCPMCRAPY